MLRRSVAWLRRRLRWLALWVPIHAVRWMLRSRWCIRVVPRWPWQPGGRWVTGYHDVVEILQRDRDFGVPYLTRMEQLGTPFLLGMNPSPDYRRQREALWAAFSSVNEPELAARTREYAERVVDEADGRIDLVEQLTDRVLAHTVATELWSGRALTGEQLEEARAISRDIFINPFRDPEVRRRAELATPRLRGVLADIADARAAAPPGTAADVLDHLLADRGLGPSEVVDSLLGVTVAWFTSVSRTFAFAFDELLADGRGAELARAQDAARRGNGEEVEQIVFEALRFRPSMPALERVCTRATELGDHRIRRGQKILLVLTGAMVDKHAIAHADEFRPDRDRHDYLHFGRETHHCVGERVARIQMREIATALLGRGRVRRAGRLRLGGPFPAHLLVTIEPA